VIVTVGATVSILTVAGIAEEPVRASIARSIRGAAAEAVHPSRSAQRATAVVVPVPLRMGVIRLAFH